MSKFNKIFLFINAIVVGIVVMAVAVIVARAWTSPSANPPSGGGAVYYSGGNVGIGNTSPGRLLSVMGASAPAIQLADTTSGSGSNDGFLLQMADSKAYLWNIENDWLQFGTNNTAQMTILASGNVGIGTQSPSYKLDVQGSAWNNIARIYSTGSSGGIEFYDTNGTRRGVVFSDSSGFGLLNNATSWALRVNQATTDIYIPGSVGIGPTSPGQKLDVFGVIRTDTAVHFNAGASGIDKIAKVNSSGFGVDANNTGNWDLLVYDGGGTYNAYTYLGYGGAAAIHSYDTNENLEISPNGTGMVGIGTANPGYKLDVNGTFAATIKNFDIPHPLDPQNKRLVHSVLEGPEAAVFYRGESQLINGKVEVSLPDYFEALTRKEGRTVLLTPLFESADESISNLAVSAVIDGKFSVRAINLNNPSQKFYWEVKAVRADVPVLEVEKPVRK